jgi:hypothetical protein
MCFTFAIKIMKRRTKITIAAMLVLSALGAYCYFGRIEYSRKKSPDGKYFEIVSVRPMYYLPLPIYRWGVHSDSSGFITIEDLEGTSFGEAPVALLQSAELTWEAGQAYLGAWAEWDLEYRTCFYWNEDRTRKIYSKR